MTDKPPEYPDAAWRTILIYITNDLNPQNIQELKFLLLDVLQKTHLEKDILGIFTVLEEQSVIGSRDPWFLLECASAIRRQDLIRKCFMKIWKDKERKPTGRLSQYRLRLHSVGMNLKERDIKLLAFLFGEKIIPKATQEKIETALELLIILEETDIIHKEDTGKLQKQLEDIGRRDLVHSLEEYHKGIPIESNPRSSEVLLPNRSRNDARSSKTWVVNQLEARLKDSVIKGYHVFRIRPPLTDPPTRLTVDPETDNRFDENACLVRAAESMDSSTKTETANELSDIAGKDLGHVPWGLSESFRCILKMGCNIFAEPTGEPRLSFPPWPKTFDKGGGAVIPCDYFFTCPNEEILRKTKESLHKALASMPEKDAMTVS